MATYIQADRPLAVTTPLGKDALLLVGFTGQEAVSQLFSFQLDLMAENRQDVAFDKLLGQKITVSLTLPDRKKRYFNGVCNRVIQGVRDKIFTAYRMEIVPQFWLLTRRAQSRIFQHISVPDILKKVLAGLDVEYEIRGTFQPRDFCVQYRETDFNFASRLMEEEGIYYFFKHAADGHKMVVANTPQSHPDMPEMSEIIFEEVEGGMRKEERIYDWQKVQELRSGKYTLWDHSFELPHKHLEADKLIQESVAVGKVTHKLKVGNNEQLEIYDFPGEYAQRFDGIDKGGGEQPSEIQKIFDDNKRTVGIRMQQEAVPGLIIRGASNCRHFVTGHKFTLKEHFNGNDQYVLTGLNHSARLSAADYRSGESGEFTYDNTFICIPFAVPFRPPQKTPKPVVQGTQTAVVVGPAGEEIFTDKYGRVKVQFHWDREGKGDADSSCWVRVATPWAGKNWGTIYIPRISMEVIVDFLEGDPDQPIVVGCAYNADMMPPYKLPDNKTMSTTKTMSSKGGGGFNELRFEDKKGQEQVFLHGEKDQDIRIKNDRREWIGNDRHLHVERDKREYIKQDDHTIVHRDQIELIERDHHVEIKGKEAIKVGGSHSLDVGGSIIAKAAENHLEEAGQEIHLKAGMKVIIEAGVQLSLKVGGNFVDIGPAGVTIQGTMVLINSGGAAGSGSPINPIPPMAAMEAAIAADAKPGSLAEVYKNQQAAMTPLQLAAATAPAHDPDSEENKEKKSWFEIVLVDEAGQPVAGEAYQITLPDGTTLATGTLDEKGFARVECIDPGQCKVTFPNLDKDAVEEA